jgi:hypothetical protein
MRIKILSVAYILIGSFFCGVMLASIIPPRHRASWWEPLVTFVFVVGIATAHLWPSTTPQKKEGE